jgi:hypothetical protein
MRIPVKPVHLLLWFLKGGKMGLRKAMMIVLIIVLSAMGIFKLVRQDISSASVGSINDFVFIYIAGHAWIDGKQPYMQESVNAEAVKLYGPAEGASYADLEIFYPPTTFSSLLPILLLPHQAVIPVVFLFSLAGFMVIAWILAEGLTGLSCILFMAFALNFAPLHSGLRPRNVTVLMAVLILIPLLQLARSRAISNWWLVLLGVGVAIKPQLGVLFLLVPLLMREWKKFLVGVSAATGSALVAVGWLALHRVYWIGPLLANLKQGPTGDQQTTLSFVYNGVANFRLINLAPVVYLLTRNDQLSKVLPVALMVVLFLCLAVLVARSPQFKPGNARDWFAVIGAVGALALLPVYSRYYGAIFILPLFAWLWSQWKRPVAKWMLVVGGALFSLPMPQFPMIWLTAMQYLHHPGSNLSQLAAGLTQENFASIRPAFWQEVICATPNLFLPTVCIFLLLLVARRNMSATADCEIEDFRREARAWLEQRGRSYAV